MGALILFQRCAEDEAVSDELIGQIQSYLKQAKHNPELVFVDEI